MSEEMKQEDPHYEERGSEKEKHCQKETPRKSKLLKRNAEEASRNTVKKKMVGEKRCWYYEGSMETRWWGESPSSE